MDVHVRKDSTATGAGEGPADIESALTTKSNDIASRNDGEIPQGATYAMKISSAMFYAALPR